MTLLQTRTTGRRNSALPTRVKWLRPGSIETVLGLIVLAILLRGWLVSLFASPRAAGLAAAYVSVVLAALPFLVAATFVSAGRRAFGRAESLHRWLSSRRLLDRPVLAVPAAVVAAVIPPAVDESAALRRGVPAGAAFAYRLALPAVSPVVIVATAVAFPGQPLFVLARVIAGIALAVVIGQLWHRFGRLEWLEPPAADPEPPVRGWGAFWTYAREDLISAGGALAVGAFVTALVTVAAPAKWSILVAARPVFSLVALTLVAVLVAVPAAAGPAVAACFTSFSPAARLAFVVAGSVVNLRDFSRQSIVYGPAFAVRFAPATLAVALLAAGGAAGVLL